jgi:hypothetical protein
MAKTKWTRSTAAKKAPPVCVRHEMDATKAGQILQPGSGNTFDIHHEHEEAVQYDFYLPVKIYFHRATERFIQRIAQLSPGSTLFRGATGIWKKDAEDTFIHRFIIEPKEFTRENLRMAIRSEINELAAELGEWRETVQQQIMFTETAVCINTADVGNWPVFQAKSTDPAALAP